MNNLKALVRKNCSAAVNRYATSLICKQQLHDVRATNSDKLFQQQYEDTVPRRQGLTKMQDKYMYIAKPNIEINLNRNRVRGYGVRNILNDDFKSEKARARWSDFRRRMIYGAFAV